MTPLFAPQIEARHTMPVQRTSNASAWTPVPPRVTYIVHRPAAFVPLCWAVGVLAIVGTVVSALLVVAGICAVALLITGVPGWAPDQVEDLLLMVPGLHRA